MSVFHSHSSSIYQVTPLDILYGWTGQDEPPLFNDSEISFPYSQGSVTENYPVPVNPAYIITFYFLNIPFNILSSYICPSLPSGLFLSNICLKLCTYIFNILLYIIHVLPIQNNIFKWWKTRKSSIFWDIMQCSPLKVNRRFGRICRLHLKGRRICQTRNQKAGGKQSDSTLKMEAIYCYETSIDFQRTTWHYIPKDRTLHNHCCETL
jgi:hypothetical protein